MMYGINFGAPDIPAHLKKRQRRIKDIPVAKGTVAILVGCCDSDEEKYRMTIQATNGHRGLYWERVKGWHCIWAYCPA